MHFLQIDLEKLELFVGDMRKQAALCRKDLETSEVSVLFRNEVNSISNYAETIKLNFK